MEPRCLFSSLPRYSVRNLAGASLSALTSSSLVPSSAQIRARTKTGNDAWPEVRLWDIRNEKRACVRGRTAPIESPLRTKPCLRRCRSIFVPLVRTYPEPDLDAHAGVTLEILRSNAGLLRNLRQDGRTKFLRIVERERTISPSALLHNPVPAHRMVMTQPSR